MYITANMLALILIAGGFLLVYKGLYYLSESYMYRNYRSVCNNPLALLVNNHGVCYANTTMQMLYCGHASKYFVERDWEKDTIECELKKIFTKMKSGYIMNLYGNYVTLSKLLGMNEGYLKGGGSTVIFLLFIVIQLHNIDKEGKLKEDHHIFFGCLEETLVEYFKFLKYEKFNKGKNLVKDKNFLKLLKNFDDKNFNPEEKILKLIRKFGMAPKIIPFIFHDYPQKKIIIKEQDIKSKVYVNGHIYVLRSLAKKIKYKHNSHIYPIIKGLDKWVALNDTRFEELHQIKFYENERVRIMFYELQE